jgi:hypothetical protein
MGDEVDERHFPRPIGRRGEQLSAVKMWLVHLKSPIDYYRRFQSRFQENASARASPHSVDFWRVSDLAVLDLSIDTHFLS